MGKTLIFSPVWLRPAITRIFCAGIDRVRSNFDVDVLCVVSPEDRTENRDILDAYGIKYVEFTNEYLGAKKNFGLRKCFELDWDYLMELNSDNVIKNELMQSYQDRDGDFLGCGHFAFFDTTTGRCKSYKYRSEYTYRTCFGIARRYSRKALENVVLWPKTAQKGMDNHSEYVLAQKGIKPEIVMFHNPVAYDIKSEVNIWNFDSVRGHECDPDFSGLNNEEIELICETVTAIV